MSSLSSIPSDWRRRKSSIVFSTKSILGSNEGIVIVELTLSLGLTGAVDIMDVYSVVGCFGFDSRLIFGGNTDIMGSGLKATDFGWL